MNTRYEEDFEEEIERNDKRSYLHEECNEYDDEDEDDVLLQEKQAWLYEQAIRGQARQRAASQLQAVLRRCVRFGYVYKGAKYKITIK